MALVVVGCKNKEANLPGNYTATLSNTGASANDPMAKMMEQVIGSSTLELKEDKTFKMTMGPAPLEGKWTFAGDTVTLNTETIMGMPVDQFSQTAKQQAAKSGQSGMLSKAGDAKQPMVMKLGDDGKLTVQAQSGQPTTATLVFSKAVAK
jgi:hypothetical protein